MQCPHIIILVVIIGKKQNNLNNECWNTLHYTAATKEITLAVRGFQNYYLYFIFTFLFIFYRRKNDLYVQNVGLESVIPSKPREIQARTLSAGIIPGRMFFFLTDHYTLPEP